MKSTRLAAFLLLAPVAAFAAAASAVSPLSPPGPDPAWSHATKG